MKNVIRVNPRSRLPALEKCPQCGGTDLELRPDGAFLCKTCFYVTKPRVDTSLLQSWAGTFFSLERAGPPPEELAFGGRVAGVGGVLLFLGIVLALGPFEIAGFAGRLLRPTAPSELAFMGGITVVAILGLVCLFAGYTMSRGDEKAWRAILPVGLLGAALGIIGPGGVLAAIGGAVAAVGGYIGRET